MIQACGAISGTGNPEAAAVKVIMTLVVTILSDADDNLHPELCSDLPKSYHSHGFLYGFGDAAQAALGTFDADIMPLVAAGKITSREQRYEGLKEAERALAELHSGKNVGKSVIVVANE